MSYMFTSESVTSGHPDKLCDFISDSILDECLAIDPFARVAIEVMVKGLDEDSKTDVENFIIIAGEVSMNSHRKIDYAEIARRCCLEIGYSDKEMGMDASNHNLCSIQVLVSRQSDEISQGVGTNNDKIEDQGAGDQGIMFGFATDESERFPSLMGTYMPLPILLAQKLTTEITKKRILGDLDWAGPDGKSQVTIEYDDNGNPKCVDSIIIAVQHKDMIGTKFKDEQEENYFIKNEIINKIINKIIPSELYNSNAKIIVNGTGRFCKGGPHADAGLTGRKIIVDTYGGIGRHGGGAFSGKDPTKVDRSAAYAARMVAKHVVASGLAKKCEIQLAYSIGLSEPISINLNVETFGSSKFDNSELEIIIKNIFDFRPSEIINNLNLRKPIYAVTTSGGHFGRKAVNDYFTWERLDKSIIKRLGGYKLE